MFPSWRNKRRINKLISPAEKKLGRQQRKPVRRISRLVYPGTRPPLLSRGRVHPLHTVCRFFRRKKTKGRRVLSQETVAHVPPRITRVRVAFCSPSPFHPPINHPVTDGFCRKFGNPGDCSPSGFLYAFSIIFLFFLYLFSAPRPPFHGLKKKARSFLPRATWYFVVFFLG